MDNYATSQAIADCERRLNALEMKLNNIENDIRQTSITLRSQFDRLAFKMTGLKNLEKRFCKGCGMVVVGDEEHECKGAKV